MAPTRRWSTQIFSLLQKRRWINRESPTWANGGGEGHRGICWPGTKFQRTNYNQKQIRPIQQWESSEGPSTTWTVKLSHNCSKVWRYGIQLGSHTKKTEHRINWVNTKESNYNWLEYKGRLCLLGLPSLTFKRLRGRDRNLQNPIWRIWQGCGTQASQGKLNHQRPLQENLQERKPAEYQEVFLHSLSSHHLEWSAKEYSQCKEHPNLQKRSGQTLEE